MERPPIICLTIGGSDPSGGAGIQADLKTFEAWKVYGTSALTMITAQNTQGVQQVELLAPDIIQAQLHSVLSDMTLHGIKVGALGSGATIDAVADVLERATLPPLVLDPVMVSKHGGRLFDQEGETKLKTRMIPLAQLITPNLAEAAALTGASVDAKSALDAAHSLSKTFNTAVLITGGRAEGNTVTDWFSDRNATRTFSHPRVLGHHQHGAGCTLSAAIAAGLAHGASLEEAITHARHYVLRAMQQAPHIGHGEGPLQHRIESKV